MEIISYKDAPRDSKHIAEVEVYHDKTFWRRIRLMLSQKGHYFINLPVYGEDDGKGGKVWIQFYEKSKSDEESFKRSILEAIQPYLNKAVHTNGPPTTQRPVNPSPAYSAPNPQYQPDLGECPF